MKPVFFTVMGLFFAFAGSPLSAQPFELQVEHLHTLRNCHGTLTVSADGLVYRTEHQEDARRWKYTDIQTLKVISPRTIEIFTYEDQKRLFGRDRVWKFRLSGEDLPAGVSALLMDNAARPAATNITNRESAQPLFDIPVKHRHLLGGCDGALRVFPDRIEYESRSLPKDSRSWRYADLEAFAHYDRFRLELITFEHHRGTATRTYDFELKATMPPAAERFIRDQLKEFERQSAQNDRK